MFTLKRKGKLVGGEHMIYTHAEAIDMGLIFVHWRDITREGQWALTDDGFVVECLKLKWYFDKRRTGTSRFDVYSKFLTFSCGRTTSFSRVFAMKNSVKGASALDGSHWADRFLKSRSGAMFVHALAMMTLQGEIDYEKLYTIIGHKRGYRNCNVSLFIKNDTILMKVMWIMNEYLNENGITAKSVIEDMKKVKDSAIADGKYGDAIKILDRFARWTDLEGAIRGERSMEDAKKNDTLAQIEARHSYVTDNLHTNTDGDQFVRINTKGSNTQLLDENGKRVFDLPLEEGEVRYMEDE